MAKTPREFMLRAIELSQQGFPAPNPRVGCVIVSSGALVGEGYHDHAGAPHAEAVALEMAGAHAKGSDVYVTLEPCNHQGRTPPCSEALINAGVRSVTYAVADPNPRATGGSARLSEAGIEVTSGLCQAEAEEVNWVFLSAMAMRRPVVFAKAAVTIDGFMAREDGTSKWITGPEARAAGHELRAEMGSVLVGAKTVLVDEPELTARIPGVVNQPLKILFDPDGELTGEEKVFGDGNYVWAVGSSHTASEQHYAIGSPPNLALLLDQLFQRGVIGVLVEGGPRTLGTFFEAGLVDQFDLFIGPVFFGAGKHFLGYSKGNKRWKVIKTRSYGEDVRLTFQPLREPVGDLGRL